MPSSLTLPFTLGLLLALVACASPPPVIIAPAEPTVKPAQARPVQRWLRWQDAVATMSTEQLSSALEGTAEPGNANQRFYYALLRQQSDAYEAWVRARDLFRELAENEELSNSQRQLAAMLERYNQSRINWYQSRDELRVQYEQTEAKLDEVKEQNALLEQKIKAITDLEATISTRKEG